MATIKFDVLTLFPEMFYGFLGSSIIKRAHDNEYLQTNLINFREFATDKHRTVDDTPYGGGGGMVLKPEPLFKAIDSIIQGIDYTPPIVLMSPQGQPFTQKKAEQLSQNSHVILLCGHYEGFDERIRNVVTDEISIGDYVLTGGELPAMIVIDCVSRLISGVLGNESSAAGDSFSTGLLEFPQYTRPAEFQGYAVPEILLSGHHAKINEWRRHQSLRRTWLRRPDLLEAAPLTPEDRAYLRELDQSSPKKE